MKIYFSPSLCGFYNDDLHGPRVFKMRDPAWEPPEPDLETERDEDATEAETPQAPLIEYENPDCKIPPDAIEITAEQHAAVFAGQAAGKNIAAGPDGFPINVDRPEPSIEIVTEDMRIRRNGLLAQTDGMVARHRDELERGGKTTLTAGEYSALQKARQDLRDLPANTKDVRKPSFPDIERFKK